MWTAKQADNFASAIQLASHIYLAGSGRSLVSGAEGRRGNAMSWVVWVVMPCTFRWADWGVAAACLRGAARADQPGCGRIAGLTWSATSGMVTTRPVASDSLAAVATSSDRNPSWPVATEDG